MENKNDQDLVASYLGGDPQSLDVLIRRHLPSVYNFIARFTGDLSEANDITQETFLKAWKHIKRFDQAKNFKTWILAIARNTSLDWLRKRRPISFSAMNNFSEDKEESFDVSDESIVSAEEVFDSAKDTKRVSEMVKTLTPSQQAVIFMKANEELTFQEMSEILGEPMNTVKSRYRRALIALKDKMNLDNAPKSHE